MSIIFYPQLYVKDGQSMNFYDGYYKVLFSIAHSYMDLG